MTSSRLRFLLSRVGAFVATVAVAVSLGVAVPTVASAAGREAALMEAGAANGVEAGIVPMSLAGFTPGNIIDDAVFFNAGSMTEADIQRFLEERGRPCESGAICLRDYHDTSRTTATDAMCGAYQGAANERASRIIYKVAQACGINPRVLIVMLQKEQGLVTHSSPSAARYRIAMGQGCPDTAACDTRYYGFFNQVFGAAWQLKRYANPPGTSQYFTWYAPGKTWNVRYNPDANCGSSPVYIANQATANLYYYTPYQPNAAALAAGYGEGDACSAYGNRNFYNYFTDWFGSTRSSPDPVGSFDSVEAEVGGVRVRGWAADPDTSSSIDVKVTIGAQSFTVRADGVRDDVRAAYPHLQRNTGFDAKLSVPPGGATTVCISVPNAAGAGSTKNLGCRTYTPRTGPPVGYLDDVRAVEGGATVTGWAVDPDTLDPVVMHVYADGKFVRESQANINRPDLSGSLFAHSLDRGYDITVPLAAGERRICVYGINVPVGDNAGFGCRTVTVAPVSERGRAPIGHLDEVTVKDRVVTATGWAIDPDTTAAIDVEMTINGQVVGGRANVARSDIGEAYPIYGPNHGFRLSATVPYGTYEVCVRAIDSATKKATSLTRCRTAEVLRIPTAPPIGSFDLAEGEVGGVRVRGWAADPDTQDPIEVRFTIGSQTTTSIADDERPDVRQAYSWAGPRTGFDVKLPAPPGGAATVCATAVNDAGLGDDTFLGCRSWPPRSGPPVGYLDSVAMSSGKVRVAGWAVDPDTLAPVTMHLYVDGAHVSTVSADRSRPDLKDHLFAHDTNRGFDALLTVDSGRHRVCAYGINVPAGDNPLLGCRDIVVPGANGHLDSVEATARGISVRGWAFDPEAPRNAISVQVEVAGRTTVLTANQQRADVAAVYPVAGESHGFSGTVDAARGTQRVCVSALTATGVKTALGCRSVTVP